MKKSILFSIVLIVVAACQSLPPSAHRATGDLYDNYRRLSKAEQVLADSLLTLALDNEGLFTICADLKPISTIRNLHLKVGRDSTRSEGTRNVVAPDHPDLRKIARITRLLESLETDQLGFLVQPFKMVWKGERAVEILVYRKDLISEMIRREQSFFGQWAFVPESDAEIVINTIEYESKYDRYRGYGYLFGYPEHAVDFFVTASKEGDRTGTNVARDFLNMPSYQGDGRFVYAVAKGSGFNETDSAIYRAAKQVTDKYKVVRRQHVADGKLNAAELIRDWGKKEGKD